MSRRSKLETCEDILEVLFQKGPLKLTHLMYKANVNCSILKELLAFLVKQGLVEERTVPKHRIVYAVTQRGITIIKYRREVKLALPIEETQESIRTPF